MSTPIETIINSQPSVSNQKKSEDEILAENGFYWREKDGVKVLVCQPLEEKGFVNGFSTRMGGVSKFPEGSLNLSGVDIDSAENIAENRRRFLKVFDMRFQIATAWQIHGDAIKIVRNDADIADQIQQADALTSHLEKTLLGIKTADCVPILIGDPQTNAFAAVHAGWRGTVQSIVVKTVEKMREVYDAHPETLFCAIGAAATCKNYEIGQDVIEAFAAKFPDSRHLFMPTRENHALIDLHTANKEQLINAGVSEKNIFIAPFCTMERSDLFFSYRLESKSFGKTGRLLSVIGRK